MLCHSTAIYHQCNHRSATMNRLTSCCPILVKPVTFQPLCKCVHTTNESHSKQQQAEAQFHDPHKANVQATWRTNTCTAKSVKTVLRKVDSSNMWCAVLSNGQEWQVYSPGTCCACIAQSAATYAKIANCAYTAKCPTGTAVLLAMAINATDVVALEHRRAALPARQRVAQFNHHVHHVASSSAKSDR